MELKKNILSALIVLLLLTAQAGGTSAVSPDYNFSPSAISGFITYLIYNREYYRASVEVERLKSYYPDHLSCPAYTASINYLMYKGGAYTSIAAQELDYSGKDNLSGEIAAIFKIDSYLKLKKFKEAQKTAEAISSFSDEFLKGLVIKRGLYFYLYNNSLPIVGNIEDYIDNYNELFRYSAYIHDMKKDPWKGVASGIIPGMGYVYAGESGTGIVAMIVIGLGASITTLSYRNNMDSFAVISGTVTGLFYGGSIIGGYRETLRYNNNLMDRLDLRLQRDFEFDRDIDDIFIKFGIRN